MIPRRFSRAALAVVGSRSPENGERRRNHARRSQRRFLAHHRREQGGQLRQRNDDGHERADMGSQRPGPDLGVAAHTRRDHLPLRQHRLLRRRGRRRDLHPGQGGQSARCGNLGHDRRRAGLYLGLEPPVARLPLRGPGQFPHRVQESPAAQLRQRLGRRGHDAQKPGQGRLRIAGHNTVPTIRPRKRPRPAARSAASTTTPPRATAIPRDRGPCPTACSQVTTADWAMA